MYRRPYPYEQQYPFHINDYQHPQQPYPMNDMNQPIENHYYPQEQSYYGEQEYSPFQYFAKPIQPPNQWPQYTDPQQYQPNYENYLPNPNQGSPRPNSILTQFQNEDGQYDINKMISTVGQLAHTVQQVSPMIKQFGSIMKNFR